ncbi:CamS family sex pheromone protein [Halalkalibacter sp. APA_J-10(15)]|uniref:CamS family sex pheromone protein n=1 Tax=Halalkalibacter sp. APA_J-10(15) TaxID=2933805 RepID=UPI001FF28695|nr:CamS family sex pheromone protein [Halalkalibacter sp. APA_J-10(15)]MCK0472338.1 CamS family sex pheromone protein [Halalkalibacter sp. APA_J-10(15)]
MKKSLGLLMIALQAIILSGCLSLFPEDEEVEREEVTDPDEQMVEVVPQLVTPDNYYRSVLYDGAYLHGESRGFGNSVVYNRLDLDKLEIGLQRIAQEYFEPEEYFFREGQFIRRNQLNAWLMRYDEDDNPTGLNPPLGDEDDLKAQEENQPRVLSHILEHNYLVENSNGQFNLGGIVIGLSLNSVYNFRVEDEEGLFYFYETDIPDDVIENEGQELADRVLERIRSENFEEGAFTDIPIVFALFQEEPRDSAIPGRFIATAKADPNSGIDRWQRIDETYYLFPSRDANNNVRNEADQFQRFSDDIQGFFDTYVGVVGTGRYLDNQIQELTIEVPIRYQGTAEIVAMTQFAANQIQERFDEGYKITLEVTSISGNVESVVIVNPNEEPVIHIF